MKPISPNSSPDYAALVQMAGGAQLGEEVRSFLSEINAPSNLTALLLVCSNIREALNEARSAWGLSSEISALDSWDKPISWVLSNFAANALAIARGPMSANFMKGRHPLWGWGFGRYPVFSALCCSAINNTRPTEYRLLQAHLMLANALLMRRHAPVAAYEDHEGDDEILKNVAQSNSAAFAVRLISLNPNHLDKLNSSKPPLDFADHCRDLGSEHDVEIDVDAAWGPNRSSHRFRVLDIAVFLEKALEERDQLAINSSSHYGPGNRLWVSGGIADFNFLVLRSGDEIFDHLAQGKIHRSRKRISVDRKTADELLAQDDDPLEDEDGELFHYPAKQMKRSYPAHGPSIWHNRASAAPAASFLPATQTQREMDHAHLQLAAGRKCFNDIGVLTSRSAPHSYRSATEGSTFIAFRAGK